MDDKNKITFETGFYYTGAQQAAKNKLVAELITVHSESPDVADNIASTFASMEDFEFLNPRLLGSVYYHVSNNFGGDWGAAAVCSTKKQLDETAMGLLEGHKGLQEGGIGRNIEKKLLAKRKYVSNVIRYLYFIAKHRKELRPADEINCDQ